MANQEHLEILNQGVESWNKWRATHFFIHPDLRGANLYTAFLRGADLSGTDLRGADLILADLSRANLKEANLSGATLWGAELSGANLSGAELRDAELRDAELIRAILKEAQLSGASLISTDLRRVNLIGADLRGVNLSNASLRDADLSGANLSGANLSNANLVGANLTKTSLKDCSIYGISAWDVQLDEAEQLNLIITPKDQPTITVDNLKVAQFIYLLLNNQEIRDVIDTITSKVVLILGRFTPERKRVLNALREELRKKDYLPIVFDFDVPTSRNITETVTTLARLARFIIADLTDPKSIPQELTAIVPNLPSVPVQPLLQARAREYGMFEHFKRYPWVLETYRYTTIDRLLASLIEHVIEPAEQKAHELAKR